MFPWKVWEFLTSTSDFQLTKHKRLERVPGAMQKQVEDLYRKWENDTGSRAVIWEVKNRYRKSWGRMMQEAGQLYGKWENDTGSGAVIREVGE